MRSVVQRDASCFRFCFPTQSLLVCDFEPTMYVFRRKVQYFL